MIDKDSIRKEAESVLSELSKALGEVDLLETYYVVSDINVTRRDGVPKKEEVFVKSLRKNAPHMDKDGNFIMEIGKWVK